MGANAWVSCEGARMRSTIVTAESHGQIDAIVPSGVGAQSLVLPKALNCITERQLALL